MPTGFSLSGKSISATFSRLVQSNTSTFEALDGLGAPFTSFNVSGSLSSFAISANTAKFGAIQVGGMAQKPPNINVGNYGFVSFTGEFTATENTPRPIDSFSTASPNYKTAEYIIDLEYGDYKQNQIALVTFQGSTAFCQEYAISYEPTYLATVSASMVEGSVRVELVPEPDVNGLIVFNCNRKTMEGI